MQNFTRRGLIGIGIGGLAAPAILRGAVPEPLAATAQGRVRGVVERGALSFRGIPYAGNPSGSARRFKAPTAPVGWTGVRDATAYGAPALQAGTAPGEPPSDENCLFLNVWTPAADHGRRPVMFYSHGGGFTIGSGARGGQNGANLARLHDVVVVESNHRLGVMGYLYLGGLLGPEYPANVGLLDLVAALRWVHENIAGFGGDPANVMIFGESGGGGKTACLYTMPAAAPFFAKASIESPIGPGDRTPAEATEIAHDAMQALALKDPRQLLTVSAADLLRFQTGDAAPAAPGTRTSARQSNNRDQVFWPTIDGTVLPERPFKAAAPRISARKPLIIGGCKDEAVFFHLFGDPGAFSLDEAGLRDRLRPRFGDRAEAWIETFRATRPGSSPSQIYMAIETASPWRAHAVDIAEKKAKQGAAPVFSYILSYRSPNKVPGTEFAIGAPHASDIATKFENVTEGGGGPLGDGSPAHRQASANMGAFWTSFARTGTPVAPGQPKWAPYTLARRGTMLIDAQCTLASDPEGAERRFWQSQPDAEKVS